MSTIAISLTFSDSLGNPMPAGVLVQAYLPFTPQVSTNLIASGYTGVGGGLTLNLSPSTAYTFAFYGNQGPSVDASGTTPATAGPLSVTVSPYVAPTATAVSYANQQIQRWPTNWFGDAAKASGGNAYALAYAPGSIMYTFDQQLQQIKLAQRPATCSGATLDSWVQDYFGSTLPRNSGEVDSAYLARAEARLSAKLGTRAGILTIAQQYGTAWISEPWKLGETGAFSNNGTLSFSGVGGIGTQSSYLLVFISPSSSQTQAQQQQMKSEILAARPGGVQTVVVSVVHNPSMTYDFPAATLNADGSWSNVDGASSHTTYALSSGQNFTISAYLAKAVVGDWAGIIIGNTTNGYQLINDGSTPNSAWHLLKWVAGVGSSIGTLQNVTNDTAYHSYRLAVIPSSPNIIEGSIDGYLFTTTDSSLALTTGTWSVTLYTGGSAGFVKLYAINGNYDDTYTGTIL